jgi:hypothetical protein
MLRNEEELTGFFLGVLLRLDVHTMHVVMWELFFAPQIGQ